jgi:hypothetical protein
MPLRLSFKKTNESKTYFNQPNLGEADLRQTTQGILYVYSTAPAAATGGLIKVNYRVKFLTPTPLALSVTVPVSWTSGTYTNPANASNTAGFGAVVGAIPANTDSSTIWEYITDQITYATVGGLARTIAAYTPIFVRYAQANSTTRFYTDLASAVAEDASMLMYGSSYDVASSGYAWAKTALQLLSAQNT